MQGEVDGAKYSLFTMNTWNSLTSSGLQIWIWFPRQYDLPSPVRVPELYVSDPNTGAHRDEVGVSKVAAEGPRHHFPLL